MTVPDHAWYDPETLLRVAPWIALAFLAVVVLAAVLSIEAPPDSGGVTVDLPVGATQ